MAAGAAATPDRRPPSGAGVVSPSSATGATAAVTSQPLSAAQQAALRRLEAWVRDDDAAARPLPTDESATLLFTATERELANGHASEDAGVPGTEMPALMAHPAGSAPAGAVAAVRTAAELEALVLRAERQESVNALAADRAAIAWIGAQVEAATALADSVAAARAALAAERELCGAARRHATPVMEDFSATAAKREREAAAAAARAAQLRPIEDARAVAATLDAAAGGSGSSPHDSRHPLVRALATLDGSIEHIKANPSFESGSAHLVELRALRCRAVRTVATQHVTRPLEAAVDAMARAAAVRRAEGARRPAGSAGGRDTETASAAGAAGASPHAHGGSELAGAGKAAGGAGDGSGGAAAPGPPSAVRGGTSGASSAAADEVRFVGLAARLRPWIRELEVREAEDAECAAVMVEVSRAYWRARRALACGPLTHRLRQLVAESVDVTQGDGGRRGSDGLGAAAAVGRCCAEALFACRSETQLHAAFFTPPPASAPRPPVAPELETLAYPLLDVLRPLVLGLKHVSALCAVVQVLDTDALAEASRVQSAGGGGGSGGADVAAGAAVESLLTRLLGDARERLTFRIQAAIRDEVRAFDHNSTAAVSAVALISGEPLAGHPSATATAVGAEAGPDGRTATAGLANTGGGAAPPGERWYPTLRAGLMLLSQAYACLPRTVFEGISQEVLEACTASLLSAASRHAAQAAPRESRLLLISQLLVLREQIAAFDSAFAVTTKALDFSATRAMLRDLTGRRPHGSSAVPASAVGGGVLSRVLDLLQRSAPSVVSTQSDAKGSLDAELRRACEAFIRDTSAPATKPILDLLTAAQEERGPTAPAAALPSASALDACFAKAEAAVEHNVATAYARMSAYLPQPSTQAILFTPIKSSIFDAYGRLATLLNATGAAEAHEQRLRALAARLETVTTPPSGAAPT